MKKMPRYVMIFGVVALGGAVGAVLLGAMARPSNCGGNSAALSACGHTILSLQMKLENTGATSSDWSLLSVEDRSEIIESSENHWVPSVRFLVRTNIGFNQSPKMIAVACDQPYDNIPQPTFWNGYKRTPAHAVAYSDGSVGLITPEKYKELNLAEFALIPRSKTNSYFESTPAKTP